MSTHGITSTDRLRLLALGAGLHATAAHPGVYPGPLRRAGFNPRNLVQHELLGCTITRPTLTTLVAGIAYRHPRSGLHKEDTILVNLQDGVATQVRPDLLERLMPEYRNTHHGRKDYLFEPRFTFLKGGI